MVKGGVDLAPLNYLLTRNKKIIKYLLSFYWW